MTIRDQDIPEFAYGLRGYDRVQVDEYISRLREYSSDMEERALLADRRAAAADQQAAAGVEREAELRRQVASAAANDVAPRLAQILELAREEAEEMRVASRLESANVTAAASENARRMIDHAKNEAQRILDTAADDERHVRTEISALLATRERLLDELDGVRSVIAELVNGHRGIAPSQPQADADPIETDGDERQAV